MSKHVFKVAVLGVRITLLMLILLLSLPSSVGVSVAQPASRPPAGLVDYERWFGSQHSHINMDGDDGAAGSTAAQAFAYAKNLPHLQYFIVTPHLHQNRSGSATLWYESTYDTIRASAISATNASFVAIAGLEVSTISSGGHWNLYNAADLVGQDHPNGDWDDADDYYDHVVGLALAGEQVAVQFNHPNSTDFGNRYEPSAAPYVGVLAVSSGPAFSTVTDFSDSGGNSESQWAHFLSLGWKLAPSADQDNHEATWGASSSEYTVIVRAKDTALNADNVIDALQEHMAYATEDANMQIGFIANNWSMGQTIGGDANVAFTIWWDNPSASICNNNVPVCRAESANDVIQSIWIYKNDFSTVAASYAPDTVSGSWAVNVTATSGDWFVVKFRDTSSLGSGRATDYTWSAPVWYDPANADAPLVVGSNDNTPPVLAPIGNKVVDELAALVFTATATDSDIPTQTLTFSLDAGSVGSLTPGGVFAWTPDETQGPGIYTTTIRVSDGVLDDAETITVTVNEVNVAPVLGAIGGKNVDELATLVFTATATDSDIPTQTLAFSLATGSVGNIEGATGRFTWTPSEADGPGAYTATVQVSDGVLDDTETITITVSEINTAPRFTSIPVTAATRAIPYNYTVMATDLDLPSNVLTLTALVKPVWLTWTPTGNGAATLSGEPAITDVGEHPITLQVRDAGGLTETQSFTLTVSAVDITPPQVLATRPVSNAGDVALDVSVVITFSEVISTSTFSYTVSPDPGGWLPVWSSDDRVVTLSHAPFAYETVYTVTLTAADDLAGNLLMGAPYQWSFTTLVQPSTIYLPLVMRNS